MPKDRVTVTAAVTPNEVEVINDLVLRGASSDGWAQNFKRHILDDPSRTASVERMEVWFLGALLAGRHAGMPEPDEKTTSQVVLQPECRVRGLVQHKVMGGRHYVTHVTVEIIVGLPTAQHVSFTFVWPEDKPVPALGSMINVTVEAIEP